MLFLDVVLPAEELHVVEQRLGVAIETALAGLELHDEIAGAGFGVDLGIRLQECVSFSEINLRHLDRELEIAKRSERIELRVRGYRRVAEHACFEIERCRARGSLPRVRKIRNRSVDARPFEI